jgi:RNA polymerase sigma factor (sigma-70 family)
MDEICFIVTASKDIIYGFRLEDRKNFISYAGVKDGCIGYPVEISYDDLWLTNAYSKNELSAIARLKDQSQETFERKTKELEDGLVKFLVKTTYGKLSPNNTLEVFGEEEFIPNICNFFKTRKFLDDNTEVYCNNKKVGVVSKYLFKEPNDVFIEKPISQKSTEELIDLYRNTQDDYIASLLFKRVEPYMNLIASRYKNSFLNEDDLSSCCNLGFARALKAFKPELGKFSTLLTYAVQNTIKIELNNKNNKFYSKKAIKNNEFDSVVTTASYEIDTTEESYTEIINSIKNVVDNLPDLERKVIKGIYFENKTEEQLGKELDCTRAWISLVNIKVLEKFRVGKQKELFEEAKLAILFNKQKPKV